MTEEQRTFLLGRLERAAQEQPEILRLRDVLLSIGGSELVAPPTKDEFATVLLGHGAVATGPVQLQAMQGNACHKNVAELWRQSNGIIAIGTGYALSPDGLWRQHSWGIRADNLSITHNFVSRTVK